MHQMLVECKYATINTQNTGWLSCEQLVSPTPNIMLRMFEA